MIRFLLVALAISAVFIAYIFTQPWLFMVAGALLLATAVIVFMEMRSMKRKSSGFEPMPLPTDTEELRQHGILDVRPRSHEQAHAEQPRRRRGSGRREDYAPRPGRRDLDPVSFAESEETQMINDLGPLHEPQNYKSLRPTEEPKRIVRRADPPTPALPPEEEIFADGSPISSPRIAQPKPPEKIPEPVARHRQEDAPAEEGVFVDGSPISVPRPIQKKPEPEEAPKEMEESSTVSEARPRPARQVPTVTTVYDGPPTDSDKKSLENQSVVRPFLSSLRSSLKAHTVALFRIDTQSSEYVMNSVVSRSPDVVTGGAFAFKGFFLSRLLPEISDLRMGVGSVTLADLKYYSTTVPVQQVVVSPVKTNGELSAFLVVDVLASDNVLDDSHLQVIEQASGLLSAMVDFKPASNVRQRVRKTSLALRMIEEGESTLPRQIIAAEMQKARREDNPMALALILMDQQSGGDGIADMTVSLPDGRIRASLEQITPMGRIERFGEGGYGVFHYGNLDDVHDWVKQAQDVLGGVMDTANAINIGVAVMSKRHRNPDDLQVDAARALRESYETGENTILIE